MVSTVGRCGVSGFEAHVAVRWVASVWCSVGYLHVLGLNGDISCLRGRPDRQLRALALATARGSPLAAHGEDVYMKISTTALGQAPLCASLARLYIKSSSSRTSSYASMSTLERTLVAPSLGLAEVWC